MKRNELYFYQAPKLPMPLSPGEEAFALHCREKKLDPMREYIFHPKRRWRFDFYFPAQKIAVEVEGGYGGRHQRRSGFEGDAYKYAHAALMGITVLRFTTAMVMRGDAIAFTLAALRGETDVDLGR